MENFKVSVDGSIIDVDHFTFNGGEEHVKLHLPCYNNCFVIASLTSSSDVMKLLMLKDAISRQDNRGEKTVLILAYVPYARQDRVCNQGEALSIKVFCDLINSMNFDVVVIADPHSDVTPALLNNVQVLEQHEIFNWHELDRSDVLVVPDAGAAKKSLKVAKELGIDEVVMADKIREVSTGKITATHVYCDDLEGKSVIIVDDIVDGGKTFVELAKVLKQKGAGEITLCVTHGIFSKGVDVLIESGISHVITTNSLPQKDHPNLKVIEL